VALSAVLVMAAVRGLQTRRICSRLAGLALVLVMGQVLLAGLEPWRLGTHLLTGLAVLGVGWALSAADVMGGGDVRLLAVLAVLAGPGLIDNVAPFAGKKATSRPVTVALASIFRDPPSMM
jgi:prepilin peptidase CpaA